MPIEQKLLIAALTGAAVLLIATLAGRVRVGGSPRLELEVDEVQFGAVPARTRVSRTLKLFNRGTADLVVAGVQSGCGDSEAFLPNATIAPGECGFLRVSVTGHGHEQGDILVHVASNDPARPLATFKTRFTLREQPRFEPTRLDFGVVQSRADLPLTRSLSVHVDDAGESGNDEWSLATPVPYWQIDSSTPIQNGVKEFRVTLLNDAPIGDLYTTLRLTSPTGNEYEVGVLGTLRGEHLALPQMIVLGPVSPDSEPQSDTVTIKRRPAAGGAAHPTLAPRFESLEIDPALLGLIDVAVKSEGDAIVARVTVSPKSVAVWTRRDVSGRVQFHYTTPTGEKQAVVVPVRVTLRVARIRDPE